MKRHWNYRVISTNCGNGEFEFAVHEVYYDTDGLPKSWSKDHVSVLTNESETWESFFTKMQEAVKKPMLEQRYDVENSKWKLEEVK